MRLQRRATDVHFSVELEHLVKAVSLDDGSQYQHRCSLETYQEVAFTIAEHAETGITGEQIARENDLPYSQVFVALAFLSERGCIEHRQRRSFPASEFLYEDAMIEYHALREKASE